MHANLPALESILKDSRPRNVDIFINTGDYIGYGPFPDETVSILKKTEVLAVKGNYDRKVLRVPEKEKHWKKSKTFKKWTAFKWAFENLSRENRQYLHLLPEKKFFEISGKTFALAHGSPQDINEYLGPETDRQRLHELAQILGVDFMITGHTHVPFVKREEKTLFINPGSVGRPNDGNPSASYSILSIGRNLAEVEHFRITYDIDRTLSTIAEKGLPEEFIEMFLKGKDLDSDGLNIGSVESMKKPFTEKEILQGCKDIIEQKVPLHAAHCKQVSDLALQLFDQLKQLHFLGPEERLILECAAILHDIGWIKGQQKHHKSSFNIIKNMDSLFPDPEKRNMIALIARYHRKAEPSEGHRPFMSLDSKGRRIVSLLASLLRVADGMDYDHVANVGNISCNYDSTKVVISCHAKVPSDLEKRRAILKSSLMGKVLERKVDIEWHSSGPTDKDT